MSKLLDWDAAEEGVKRACEAIVFRETWAQQLIIEHFFVAMKLVTLNADQTAGGCDALEAERDLFRYVRREDRTLP